jgi:hypothetical protein
VKVRITATPRVAEVDGVELRGLKPGAVREMAASIAAWLIAERCAVPEMRRDVVADSAEDFYGVLNHTTLKNPPNCPRRRVGD